MSLADKYREELKSQGINVEIKGIKIKKDRTKLILILIGIALAIPIYFLIFTNYNSCSIYALALSGGVSSVSGSFYFKCGLNAIMYSVSAVLLISIILLIILKVIRKRRNRRIYAV
ncbi:MAG: hypothetical protein M1322_04090 [Candidatus Parvarchaeota archaeon]|jgi:uncharacterized membrane protein|nr:hypothetical protein [Candidatus Parvarchaeota archaeon]MCL5107260.1 hypothetical protein [Candidatus Parvarchaeota archaeon]